ncbi:transcription-repair coupling factor [Hahella sp. KA22]|uniref:transcription-repair coupling factor n=1 Tax=Hahella sp. KA22 TaxID=1628392 RepID=UPI000FDE0FDB|nr:transcription-repair coupling factor [Hahella sp. KA22]AZZ93034.1 transcription-repair coupling factor [Hahella sp. KA22]QAY56408.1 transcription-repair coupling factor [Hahella sp. KA22]
MTERRQLPSNSTTIKYWPQAVGQSDAYILAQALKEQKRLLVVITPDMPSADQLESAVKFFLGDAKKNENTPPILTLPDWETLPYDTFSPHQDIISQRIQTLHKLPTCASGLLIVPLSTIMVRLAPKEFVQRSTLILRKGQPLRIDSYRSELEQAGYRCVDTVYEHGEFAVRGSIFDIFPMGSKAPYRIDLFDEEVETLRQFDPETQRSAGQVDEISLLPAHEFPLNGTSIQLFKDNFYEKFPGASRNIPLLQDISRGIATPGLEYYLTLFFTETASLLDYVAKDACFALYDGLHEKALHFWKDLEQRYEDLRHDIQRPILPPADIYLRVEELFEGLKQFPRAQFSAKSEETDKPFSPLPHLALDAKKENPLQAIDCAQQDSGYKVVLCAESPGRQQALMDTFKEHGRPLNLLESWEACLKSAVPWNITVAELAKGFADNENRILVVAEADLYEGRVLQRRRRKRTQESPENIIQNLTELKLNAPVVHIDHGIGRYKGLQSLEVDGQKQEFLVLEYANEAKLYVPVSSLHLISRYAGLDDNLAPINKLGTDRWSAAKRQAAEKIKDSAAELLEIYAKRELHKGYACPPPDEHYRAFSATFPFEETPDQATTINAVLQDMMKPRPMDRLVCGDVGFGKTEVAMRAAFLAAHAGRQVAILTPTTLLAQQHFQSFQDRFADTAINVELISRFRSAGDIEKVKDKLSEGKVDILVGTHKLLQKDIQFKNLGLLIIDEEHRFGVQQKEKVKSLRANIDILTLTATPIPRTLNLSFQGVRDLSIIATPPEKRLSVKTFVQEHSNSIIKEAVLREILRGGQVFFLHNEVNTINKAAAELQEMVPDARVAVAHGQMRERELEKVMSDFYHKRFNVLMCTTIIETGIDIPSANTIIIERADKFGLAQLHQLRGRVGRSHHQAYAYLLTPPPRNLTEDAKKRLDAISSAQDLGAGFTLATHDLEIRGAGELLGEEQSGHIQNIGFTLYLQLLDAAVKAMREGKELDLTQPIDQGCEVNLRLPALIPDDYLPDVHNRLILYKRIASAKDEDALQSLQIEMIDRFGLLPDATKNLFRQARLKLTADRLGIARIDIGAKGGVIEFNAKTTIEPIKLVNLIQREPKHYKLDGGSKLRVTRSLEDKEDRMQFVEKLLKSFAPARA